VGTAARLRKTEEWLADAISTRCPSSPKPVSWVWCENNYFTEKCSGSEAGSYLRLIDVCITQLEVPQ